MSSKISSIKSVGSGFQLPLYATAHGKVKMKNSGELPIVRLPDGKPSFWGNLFCLHLHAKGLSTFNRGGTIRTYLMAISLLLKYAFYNSISITDITNSRFQHFMASLRAKRLDGENKRKGKRIRRVIYQSLDFLEFVGEMMGNADFVSKQGVIRAYRPTEKKPFNTENPYTRSSSWIVEDLPLDDAPGEGLAIGIDTVKALKNETRNCSSSFLSARNHLIFEIFEATGGRRGELARQTVKSIYDAINNLKTPNCLRIDSLKQQGKSSSREVWVNPAVLSMADDYIKRSRQRVMRQTIGTSNDHGFLFIAERTGRPLSINYLTTLTHNLKKKAGIEGKAHLHQFRHLFIQNLHHDLNLTLDSSVDSKIQGYADRNEIIILKLMQSAGHRSRSSPIHYLKQAQQELAALELPDKLVMRNRIFDKLDDAILMISERGTPMSDREYRKFTDTVLMAFLKELKQ
ncbi:site-specific integrase [Pseudomonas sp. NBRC 111139]|uniref:tyrosine-type recombinase/integrase n=1 Tax=Pseudomonas sp. NBRC 111139 TaxID=1661054 RepID=UPI0009F46B15|nr:site-specific integrase [Pseudomonas sp. NBRC 111139]